MTTHPVQFHVDTPERMERIHVLVRLVLLIALGTLGWSSLYWLLYLMLPAVAALLIGASGPESYGTEDAPRIIRGLRWLAGAYAYLWLLTDKAPSADAQDLQIEAHVAPTAGAALLRLLSSVPAVLLLALLSMVAGVLWLVAAVMILVRGRVPRGIAGFLELTLRYQFRLAAYHLSLVDCYPSVESAPPARLPHAGVA